MGDPTDRESVVDGDLSVIGIGNLKIADASIFPSLTSGNINAPSMMVGLNAAKILQKKSSKL